MNTTYTIPKTGQMVIVRSRPGVIRDVIEYNNSQSGVFHAVEVHYMDGWFYPENEIIIWEREWNPQIIKTNTRPNISSVSPDHPEEFNNFINAYRWSSINKLKVEEKFEDITLISPWQSAVQIEDYQLYPVIKSLLMPRISLLLADDVGLGKTIEAGLIISEMIARNRVKRILIVCPASLQNQWKDEMKEKFYLDFEIIDRKSTFELQKSMGIDSNPWAVFPKIITSMDYLRQPDVLESFKSAGYSIKGEDETKLPWQMLVVDEAHNFCPNYSGNNSQRYEMLREISILFEHKLFLTATPHNGYTHSYTGLLELLDPVRFKQTTDDEEIPKEHLNNVVIRRLKKDLNTEKHSRFADRKVESIDLKLKSYEKELYQALKLYKESCRKLLSKNSKEKYLADFLLKLLTKRLLSGSYAFACTWWNHAAGLKESDIISIDELEFLTNRAASSIEDDYEREQREDESARKSGAWLRQYSEDLKFEIDNINKILEKMNLGYEIIKNPVDKITKFAEESKWEELEKWIKLNLLDNKNFKKDERLIIFTEYRQTLSYLQERFKKIKIDAPYIDTLYGGMTNEKRQEIKERFNDPDSDLRILLATDAASEGINLQTGCRYVIHYDVPWNPMRMEQRNGRVDRHGQFRDVYVYHFTSSDDFDLEFLGRIAEKIDQVREDLGSVSQLLDRIIEEYFNDGDNAAEFLKTINSKNKLENNVDNELMRTMIKTSLQRFRAVEMSLKLDKKNIASMLSSSFKYEKGEILSEGNYYRINKIPPAWKGLIHDTIEIKSGNCMGAIPKISFDPEEFEVEKNGRKLFVSKPDTALLRLGHPIMQKALFLLKKSLWENKPNNRWTLTKSNLPSGIEQVMNLYLFIEVSNKLREIVHQEVITIPYQIDGEDMIEIADELKYQLNTIEKQELEREELTIINNKIQDLWDDISPKIKNILEDKKGYYKNKFENIFELLKERELKNQKELFDGRIKDLTDYNTQKELEKIDKNLQKQYKALEGAMFVTDARAEKILSLEQQKELILKNKDIMRELLKDERKRIIEKVIPKKFALNNIEVYCLGVEFNIRK